MTPTRKQGNRADNKTADAGVEWAFREAIKVPHAPAPTPCPDCYQIPCRCGETAHAFHRGHRQETDYQETNNRAT